MIQNNPPSIKKRVKLCMKFCNSRMAVPTKGIEEGPLYIFGDEKVTSFRPGQCIGLNKITFNARMFLKLCDAMNLLHKDKFKSNGKLDWHDLVIDEFGEQILIWITIHECSHVNQRDAWFPCKNEDTYYAMEYANEINTFNFMEKYEDEINECFNIKLNIPKLKKLSTYLTKKYNHKYMAYENNVDKLFNILSIISCTNLYKHKPFVKWRVNRVDYFIDLSSVDEEGAIESLAILNEKIWNGYKYDINILVDELDNNISITFKRNGKKTDKVSFSKKGVVIDMNGVKHDFPQWYYSGGDADWHPYPEYISK